MLPLLLIPGMMCDARMWGAVPELLAPRPVLHGLPTGGESMAAIAAQLLSKAPPRFAVAGLSMGGIVAMEMLRQAPARIAALALLDTNPWAERPEVQARRAPQMVRAKDDLLGLMEQDFLPHYLAAETRAEPILSLCRAMALDLGPAVFADQSRALRDRIDQSATLAAFAGPALVLMGREDRLCPLDRHDGMHALMPQSALVLLDHAGHLPPLEQPTATAAALRLWLKDCP